VSWQDELESARGRCGDMSPVTEMAPEAGSWLWESWPFKGWQGSSDWAPSSHPGRLFIWTKERVYVRVEGDRGDYLVSAPRNPPGDSR
jgi:hypothetical protein